MHIFLSNPPGYGRHMCFISFGEGVHTSASEPKTNDRLCPRVWWVTLNSLDAFFFYSVNLLPLKFLATGHVPPYLLLVMPLPRKTKPFSCISNLTSVFVSALFHYFPWRLAPRWRSTWPARCSPALSVPSPPQPRS